MEELKAVETRPLAMSDFAAATLMKGEVPVKKSLWIVVGFAALVSPMLTANPAMACSRPGTPTNVYVKIPSNYSRTGVVPKNGALTLLWINRASERPITFDIDRMEGGVRVRGITGGTFYSRDTSNYIGTDFQDLNYKYTYCFRVRARVDYGSGGCVSQHWSAWACGRPAYPSLFTKKQACDARYKTAREHARCMMSRR
jgi:hypothetical protein